MQFPRWGNNCSEGASFTKFIHHVLFGQDEVRIKARLNELVCGYEKSAGSFGLQKLNFSSEQDPRELGRFLQSPSLFEEKKLFIVYNAFAIKESQSPPLLRILNAHNLSERTDTIGVFIFSGEKEAGIKKNPELWNFLNQRSNSVEGFPSLYGPALAKWVERELGICNLKISGSALKKLLFYTGSSIGKIHQEIGKLVCYKKRGTIDENDVELLITKYENVSAFAVADNLGNKQKLRAIESFYKYLSGGDDLNGLFGALIYQFRNLLLIKSMVNDKITYAEISKKLKLHPYVMRKSFEMAKKFESGDLEKIYEKLAGGEKSVKSGENAISEVIFDLILTT